MSSDKSQLTRVFSESVSDLRQFVIRKLKGDDEVDDVLQETYLALVEMDPVILSSIKDDRSYIFGIANNLVRSHIAKNIRRRLIKDSSALVEELDCPVSAPDVILESKHRAAQLTAALNNMPAKRRQVFVLYRFKNLSVTQIAKELDMSEHAVEKSIVRALSFCRDWLQRRDA